MAERKKKVVIEKESIIEPIINLNTEIKPEVIKEEKEKEKEKEIKTEVKPEKIKIQRKKNNDNNILEKARLIHEENEKLKAELYNKQLKKIGESDEVVNKKKSEEKVINQLEPETPKSETRKIKFNELSNSKQKQILRMMGRF